MTQRTSLAVAVFLGALTPLVFAAPQAPEPRTVISAANADKLRSLRELDRAAFRILLGPKRGEVTFLDFGESIEIVDDVNFQPLRKVAERSRPLSFAASKDGRLHAWTERNSQNLYVHDVANGKTIDFVAGVSIHRPQFSLDGKLIAIGHTVVTAADGHGGGYSEMKLFDVTGKHLRTLESSKQGGLTPVFSPDGKLLAVGNRNYETRLFEVATGKLLQTLERRMTHEIAFSPDGKLLAASYVDGALAMWDVATGKLLRSVSTGAQQLLSVDWSPKGDVLATAGWKGKLILWDPNKLTRLKELDASPYGHQVRFTADGTRLLSSGGADLTAKGQRKVIVWGVPD